MCQHSTKISGRLNIMLISTTIHLHCNWLSWMQVQQREWCSRDPTYTTKQKWHFQILTYYKTAKISTQGVSKIPCSDAEPPLRPAHLHLDTHEEFTNFDFQAPLKTARWGIFCEIIIIWRKFYTMSDLYSRIAELTSKKRIDAKTTNVHPRQYLCYIQPSSECELICKEKKQLIRNDIGQVVINWFIWKYRPFPKRAKRTETTAEPLDQMTVSRPRTQQHN